MLNKIKFWSTWNKLLPFLIDVIAHTVVSARKYDGLLIIIQQIIPHSCPQSECIMRLCHYFSHLTKYKITVCSKVRFKRVAWFVCCAFV